MLAPGATSPTTAGPCYRKTDLSVMMYCKSFDSVFSQLFFRVYVFIMCSVLSACMPAAQKKIPHLIIDDCELSCGC